MIEVGPDQVVKTNKFYSAFLTCTVALSFPNIRVTQRPLGADPRPLPGVEFILKSFDQYQAVGIGDLPGCEEAHNFIRSLIRNPMFLSKVADVWTLSINVRVGTS